MLALASVFRGVYPPLASMVITCLPSTVVMFFDICSVEGVEEVFLVSMIIGIDAKVARIIRAIIFFIFEMSDAIKN